MSQQAKNYTVKSVDKVLDIAELLRQEPNGMTITEICMATKLPKSTIHGLLHTLADRGYLVADESTKRFKLGLKFFEIGYSYLNNLNLSEEIRVILTEVANKGSETVHLAILDGTDVVYIEKIESGHEIRMASFVGKRLPAHSTGVGQAMLSCLSEEELSSRYKNKNLQKFTEHTVTTLEKLKNKLELARKNGYAFDDQESSRGIQCVAVPVFNRHGKMVAGLSVSVPVFRMVPGRKEELLQMVREGARKLARVWLAS
ncbi:MAG: IclR family transcriptional regulator [Eubacteriales bacterium]